MRVERGQRLVEQQHARARSQRARERDALALAARQRVDRLVRMRGEPHHREQRVDALAQHARLGPADPQPIADIAAHRQVRKQRIVLEHHPDAALFDRQRGHVVGAERDRAARIGRIEPGDQAQRRRLAAAGRAEQHERLARADREIERLQHARAVEGFRAAGQGDRYGVEFHRRGSGKGGDKGEGDGRSNRKSHRKSHRRSKAENNGGATKARRGRNESAARTGIAKAARRRRSISGACTCDRVCDRARPAARRRAVASRRAAAASSAGTGSCTRCRFRGAVTRTYRRGRQAASSCRACGAST
ncbi:hypothetical protein DO71_5700 [Burkholderia pseudomallei]|nr:hypothetical protein DO71_5700 [Burkholderia pseudomallei]